MRLRTLRWSVPLGLVVLLLAACSSGTDDAAETTLASATTVVETTTTSGSTTTTTVPTTTTTAPTTTATSALLEGLGPYEVTSTVVSHETTQDISVWAPEAEGSWPVVYMMHGYQGRGQDLAITATELASHGMVVFAPDIREPQHHQQDVECGYRYARSVAHEFGGDLDQPVTFVGDSLGSTVAVRIGLTEAIHGPGGSYHECFTGVRRPDVIVAIAGCHYEVEGQTVAWYTMEEWLPLIEGDARRNLDADLVLVVGENDKDCQPWQSEDATEALRSHGYDTKLVVVPGGDHGNVVFWGLIDGEWVTVPDDPVGHEVVQTILDAIAAATP